MRKSAITTRRSLILGFVGALPVWRLANAAAPPTARSAVAPAATASSELSDACTALMNDLDMLLAARARASGLAAQSGQLQANGANADAVAAKVHEVEAMLAEIAAQTIKMEQLGLKISQLQSLLGNNADAEGKCARLNRQLFATGYLGSAQMASLTRGQFQWTAEEIQSAIVRGRAASDQFKAPIAAQLRAQRSAIAQPSMLHPLPARSLP